MNSLSEIIELMNKSDKLAFIQYLEAKNKRKDVKNIRLYKLIETDDIKAINNLYKNKNSKNSYHALRKRLYDNLIEFISNRSFEKNTEEIHESLRYLVLSRFLLENNLFKTAFQFLRKAEIQAEKLEQFSLLNEIYQTQLQFQHLNSSLNLDDLLQKIEINQTKIQTEISLNLGYATLRKELQAIHLQGKIIDFEELISQTLQRFNLNLKSIITYKSLYQILFIANEFGNIQQDFSRIERFIQKANSFIETKKENSNLHLFYHIQILYFLANYYLRTNQYENSSKYLLEMKELMQEKNQLYKNKFQGKWALLTALNQHFIGQNELALSTIEETTKLKKKLPLEEIYDLILCKVLILGQIKSYLVQKELAKLNHTDSYFEKKMGMLWTIRKNVMEIIIHFQFENDDLAFSRLQSFKRRYKKYLFSVKEERVFTFISYIEQILKKPEIVQKSSFKFEIKNFIESDSQNDPFIKGFYHWLMKKIQ